jgi:hypothetical protein
MAVRSDSAQDVEQDARIVLDWLRASYAGGLAPLFPPLVICREALGRDKQCDPGAWGRLWRVLPMLLERGLIEEGQLPQGDPGVRLSARGAQGG